MFKKLLAFFLAFAALISFSACGKDGEADESRSNEEESLLSSDGMSSEDMPSEQLLGKLNRGYAVDEGAAVTEGDLIIVQVNGVASFALESGAMPTLKAFADKNTHYTQFFAQQDGTEGLYSTFTSLYAPIDGIDAEGDYYTLANLFADNGYKVMASLSDESALLATAMGVDNRVEGNCYTAIDNALKLAQNDKSELYFIEFDAISYPYVLDLDKLFSYGGYKSLNSYLNCAAYADSKLGGFLEAVDAMGDKAPTVLVYGTAPVLDGKYSVYTEEYKELFPDGFSYGQAFGTPLIIKDKNIESGKVDCFATVYDIFPTLAALYGFDGDKLLVSGDNLYNNSTLPVGGAKVEDAANLAAGKSYTFMPEDGTDPQYMFPSLGDNGVMLTNGVVTDGKNIPESGCGFVLKQCSKTHYVTIDLGEEKHFDRVSLAGVAYDGTKYTGLSGDAFTVEISGDGEKFTATSGDCSFIQEEDSVFRTYTLSLDSVGKGRYVRLGFSGTSSYLTASEVFVYECAPETEDSEDEGKLRAFSMQADGVRGGFITDTIYYIRSTGISSAYSRASLNELSVRQYKDLNNATLDLINECEHAVDCGYFAETVDYAGMYDSLPNRRTVLLKTESAESAGSMAGHRGYLKNYAVTYTADALSGISGGIKCAGGRLVLEDGTLEGYFVSDEFLTTDFYKLFVALYGNTNGGYTKLYVSFADENAINTPWLLIESYDDKGYVEGSGFISTYNDAVSDRFRIKVIMGRADADSQSPEIQTVTVTPVGAAPELDAAVTEDAFEASVTLGSVPADADFGVLATEALLASALSRDADYKKATDFFGKWTFDLNAGYLNVLARYACEKGVFAYVDAYCGENFIAALSHGQPVLFIHGDKPVLAVGYSSAGITVICGGDGTKELIPFEEIRNNTEVLIVDSTLYTPQIIDDFISETSAVRPGIIVDKKKYIVIHNTGNYSVGSTAAAHAAYIQGLENQPDRSVSWHYTVDDKEIYHHLPDNESAWHASDGTYGEGNQFGIGIEICVNGFPGVYEGEEYEVWLEQFMRALKNASYLVAKLMVENELGMDDIKQHWDFAPDKKNCPMQMRYNSASGTFTRDEGDMWIYFIDQVEKQYARLTAEDIE